MIREALRAIFEAVEADEHLIAERDRAIGQLARAERRRDAEVARAEKAEAKLDEALKQRRLIEDSFTKLRYDVLAVARELHALVRSGRAHPGNLVLQQYAAAVESAAEKLDLAAYLRAGESPTNTREPEPEPKYLAARIVRSDGKIIEELEAREDVGIGMIAGRPSPEQYEAAAARALKTAAALRAARAKPSEETVERKAAEVDHTARRLAALRAEKKARLRREYGIELCEACGAILREDTPRVACEDCSLCLACGDSMGGA